MFKNVRKEEITVPAQMSYLIQVREFIEHIGKKYKFDDKIINSFKLVIDEACTNIIRHGYRDIKNGEITIKAIIRRLSLTILIIDQGKSYDPSQASTPDLGKYVDIGKKGGLGIMMMRKLMDDLQYSVTERGNEFRLTKNRDDTRESKLVEKWHSLNLRWKYSMAAAIIFSVVVFSIFIPLIIGIDNDVKKEILSTSAAGCLSLADNTISDILDDQDWNLAEKAQALQSNYEQIIKEVFILNPDRRVLARSNVLKSDGFGLYQIPPITEQVDSIDNVAINRYFLSSDTTFIYDLSTEIHQTLTGEGALLGYIHVWIDLETVDDMANSRKFNIFVLLFIVLAIGYLGSFFLIHRILTPFHSLADWVRQVVHGKVDQDEIDIDASDELGEIAQAFNEMTHKFRKAQVNLMEQQKLQKELQVAQEIQQMLLPSDFPEVEGYEIASFYEAAKEVGGDLFDFVEVDEDTIGICVADVSGKGVPGSLIMTMIRTALRLESRGNKNPAEVLSKVNSFVADDMKRGMFVTMFYVVLDSRNRIIHYASAGHNPMMLYRGSTKQTYYLNPSGFPVGIQLPDPDLFAKKIETDSIRLKEDDILVLYTDGITEAMNSQRELYKEERFLSAIRDNAHLDVGEFIKSINEDLKTFTGGAQQNDDITFVSIKEKMMHSEVVLRIQRELSQLISEGTRVKDALDQLRVSPYHYYKYKDIIDRGGMDGLKSFLEDQDHIEKKHLSLEVKTKIFDIIRKNPGYGAKRIASEIATSEYGSLKIDAGRIYNELVKLRLNTKKMRERHLEKGKKTHFKQPGTPLLTLDGSVILDYESAEKEIAKRQGESPVKFEPPTADAPSKRKEFVRSMSSTGSKIDLESDPDKSPGTLIHKPAKPHQPIEEKPVEPAQDQDKKIQHAPEPEKEKPTDKTEAERIETSTKTPPELDKIAKQEDEIEEYPKSGQEEPVLESETVDTKVSAEPPAEPEDYIIEEPESEPIIQIEKKLPTQVAEPEEIISQSKPSIQTDVNLEKDVEDKFEIDKAQSTKSEDLRKVPEPGFTEKETLQKPDTERTPVEPVQERKTTAKEVAPPRETDEKPYTKEELLEQVTSVIDQDKVKKFYNLISDDINALEMVSSKIQTSTELKKDIKKITVILSIASKHPILKEIKDIKLIFDRGKEAFTFISDNFEGIRREHIIASTKDLLNCLRKDNKLEDYSQIFETINKIGLIQHKLKQEVTTHKFGKSKEFDRIRQKITQKELISTRSILESITKQEEK